MFVIGVDCERVRGSALKAAHRESRRRRGAYARGTQVDAVTGYTDVVRRGRPFENEAGRARACHSRRERGGRRQAVSTACATAVALSLIEGGGPGVMLLQESEVVSNGRRRKDP